MLLPQDKLDQLVSSAAKLREVVKDLTNEERAAFFVVMLQDCIQKEKTECKAMEMAKEISTLLIEAADAVEE